MLLTQRIVQEQLDHGRLSAWQAAAFTELQDKVADEAFPCTFGTVALKKGDILFAFLETAEQAALVEGLVTAVGEYAGFVQTQSLVKASMMPLAIFMRPPTACQTMRAYFDYGWQLLQAIHEQDPRPWPEQIAHDPEAADWSFCFAGVPFFINFKTPLHHKRRSRQIKHSYLWLVQARDGFDIVAGNTPQGQNARRIIREKLALYDEVPIYPELAYFGDESNREWKQYFVPDDNTPLAQKCPFITKHTSIDNSPHRL